MSGYPVQAAWFGNENSGRMQSPPDGLYVVRNGVAVAVTDSDLPRMAVAISGAPFASARSMAKARAVIAALTRPADGASE